MFGPVRPWDRSNDETGENLRQAMAQNPYLHVMIQSGYYDGATTYFNAKYTMWQLDPSGRMKDRFRFEGYRSGHMMYLRKEDLKNANNHIREFITATIPEAGTPRQILTNRMASPILKRIPNLGFFSIFLSSSITKLVTPAIYSFQFQKKGPYLQNECKIVETPNSTKLFPYLPLYLNQQTMNTKL